MKLLIVTRADSNYTEISDITHPIIRKYAKKWDAEFLILDEKYDYPNCSGNQKKFYRIFNINKLLNVYDRVLHLDSDILINKNCPNLFEVIPIDEIGISYEDVGSRKANRYNRIKEAQEFFGNIGWESGYINVGVMLVSKQHKDIFQDINGKLWFGLGSADVVIGYNIKKFNFKVFELSYQFNHTIIFSERWNGRANRFKSYIIHYAGKGIFDKKFLSRRKYKFTRVEQIKHDLKKIYGKKYELQ